MKAGLEVSVVYNGREYFLSKEDILLLPSIYRIILKEFGALRILLDEC